MRRKIVTVETVILEDSIDYILPEPREHLCTIPADLATIQTILPSRGLKGRYQDQKGPFYRARDEKPETKTTPKRNYKLYADFVVRKTEIKRKIYVLDSVAGQNFVQAS